jgi:hypothetical protein
MKNNKTTVKDDEPVKSQNCDGFEKIRGQGVQTGYRPEGLGLCILAGYEEILRNAAYIEVRRNDEGCSATQHPDFLRDHQTICESGIERRKPFRLKKRRGCLCLSTLVKIL